MPASSTASAAKTSASVGVRQLLSSPATWAIIIVNIVRCHRSQAAFDCGLDGTAHVISAEGLSLLTQYSIHRDALLSPSATGEPLGLFYLPVIYTDVFLSGARITDTLSHVDIRFHDDTRVR